MGRLVRLLCALAATLLLVTTTALGRVESDSPYTKKQTYNTALRYLRVDLGYEVTERDPEAAYLLFKYVPPGRKATHNGAIEIIEASDAVKLYVRLPQMPRYHEQVLSDRLLKKLREEYGKPPERKPPPEEPDESPDGGAT